MKAIFLMLSLLSISSFAKEGGNGGGVHDCGVRGVELYDFYEGRNTLLHGIRVWTPDSSLSVKDYLGKALEHIERDIPEVAPHIGSKLAELLSIPYDELVMNFSIPLIPDADIVFVDEGCEYRQVANWNERFEKIIIRKSIFERLDNMSKAGLYIHEVVYKISRDSKISLRNSDKVRKIVARIFSDEVLTPEDARIIYSEEAMIQHSLPYCSFYMNQGSELINLLSRTNKMCRTSTSEAEFAQLKEMVRTIEGQIQNTTKNCEDKCLWSEAVQTCRDTTKFIGKACLRFPGEAK